MRKNKKKTITPKLNFNILFLILIPIVLIGTTAAKYVYEQKNDVVYEAETFYFESDLLSDNTNPKAYNYQKGEDNISFYISNNIDNLRHSDVDIKYKAKITDIQGKEITDKAGQVVKEVTGTLSSEQISKQKIEFTNLPGGSYIVTATAEEPYQKSLQATFVLTEKEEDITYQVSDSEGSPVLQLTVISKDYSGSIKITWPGGVAPDSTISKLANVNTGYASGSTTTSFEANSEYTFQFFKRTPNSIYSKDNFTVERN